MNIVWTDISKTEYDLLYDRNVEYASMEVDGYTDDEVKVFMNLSEPGFTVVLIDNDPEDLSQGYKSCKRETYAGALSIAVQIAASLITVREIMTATADRVDAAKSDPYVHHRGEVVSANKVRCGCGEEFPTVDHPEPGHWESPALDAHRAQFKSASNVN